MLCTLLVMLAYRTDKPLSRVFSHHTYLYGTQEVSDTNSAVLPKRLYFIIPPLLIALILLKGLFIGYYESNRRAEPDAEHSGSIAVAHGDAYIA